MIRVSESIELVDIEALVPYARNSRMHSDAQVEQVAASIKEFGFTNPVLIDGDGGIIAGHGRVLAARKLGMVEVPCIRLGHLTEAQRRAYVIADNKLALNSGWDEKLLALEIKDLAGMEFDIALMGFDDGELSALLNPGKAGLTDPDDTPEVQPAPISKLGDMWLMGNHRIICGDSTDSGSVALLMVGVMADAVLTDPPYGQSQAGVPGDDPENLANVVKAVRILPVTSIPASSILLFMFAKEADIISKGIGE